jgi:maleylacetoacetate isomerase
MQLYTYFRSSAAYRVRIALGLKGLDYTAVPVHLVKNGGEHLQPRYRQVNPGALVPTLVDGATHIPQSLAIIEYLEETHPTPALLPSDAAGRARVRALALDVACDLHPLNNLRVLDYLTGSLGLSGTQRKDWYRHWVAVGLATVEQRLAGHPATGRFCHGDVPTMADCCLVPQIFNAARFGCSLDGFPAIRRIVEECERLPAFRAAAPASQPDAE